MKIRLPRPTRAGFTLIELVVVVTIIALLFALTIGGFTYAQRSAARSKTTTTLKAIQSALERYNTEFGEYPEPSNPGDTVSMGNKIYEASGATMLYQALSGDGYNNIKIATTPSGDADPSSNGSLDEAESKSVMLTDMPKEIWVFQENKYYMIDGFGRPFQYTKAVPIDPNGTGGASTALTINPTYDLWSYGEDEENVTARSIDTLTDEQLKQKSVLWIKNW